MKKMMTTAALLCTLLLTLTLSSPPTHAQTGSLEFVGHIGNATRGIFIEGNTAYLGEGGLLTILDITNPPPQSYLVNQIYCL